MATEDLIAAQRSAAEWSSLTFAATILLGGLAGLGIYVLWRTLEAARRAAVAADAALREARQSTATTLSILQDTADRQLRAYLSILKVEATIHPADTTVEIGLLTVLKNAGQTPAQLTGLSIEFGATGDAASGSSANHHQREIGPGTEMEQTSKMTTAVEAFPLVGDSVQRHGSVKAVVRYRYRDYLEREWTKSTEFSAPVWFHVLARVPFKVTLNSIADVDAEGGVFDTASPLLYERPRAAE